MKTQIINLFEKFKKDMPLSIAGSLSLKPFINFLNKKIETGSEVNARFFHFILEQLELQGDVEDISLDDIDKYHRAFEMVYMTLTSQVVDEKNNYWGLSIPFTPIIFFGTDGYYDLLVNKEGILKKNVMGSEDVAERKHKVLGIIYNFLLERLYNYPTGQKTEVIHAMYDEQKQSNLYYRIEFDTTFVDAKYDGELPQLDFEALQRYYNEHHNTMGYLQDKLVLDKFSFEGFSIVTITDITAQYALDTIKNIVVNLAPGQKVFADISNALKTMIGNSSLDINLFPILKVNDTLVVDNFDGIDEKMELACVRYDIDKENYIKVLEDYINNPQFIYKKNTTTSTEIDEEMCRKMDNMGIKSLAIIPIFFQKTLVGILQIFSDQEDAIQENMLNVLEPSIPLLEQLLQTSIDDFNNDLDKVVREKFTSLQPSVQWKFNEVAWEYVRSKEEDNKALISNVVFKDVHPLYGAIDVRNSSLERNNALRADLQHQIELLINVLEKLNDRHKLSIIYEMAFKAKNWLEKINDYIMPDDEYKLTTFLENEVTPFMLHFRQTYPQDAHLIESYYEATSAEGVAFKNRRALEESLQLLNTSIGNLLDEMNVEVQNTYPCYFEKFRSDGVEYDIYIGQSIVPNIPFHPLYLKNLRLWQLSSMAKIANLTQSLLPKMEKKLQTTQLIFVHSNTIDISFRNDEHRFDVEGAYNIRYEMIKKRIDKVHIKNTDERLTQPGKIALVYFQQKDVEEYASFIQYLQSQNILADDLEYLDLEELQGVNGLKALRVGVVMQEENTNVKVAMALEKM